MDKINEQLYEANIELVDRNKLLEEDVKKLERRINNALEYIEAAFKEDEINVGNIYHSVYDALYILLKGEEYGNNWEDSSN